MPASADIAPDPLSGGRSIQSVDDKSPVKLVTEKIVIDLSDTRATTRGDFSLKNTGPLPIALDIGLPFAYPDDLKDFKVVIDGKEVNMQDRVITSISALARLRLL